MSAPDGPCSVCNDLDPTCEHCHWEFPPNAEQRLRALLPKCPTCDGDGEVMIDASDEYGSAGIGHYIPGLCPDCDGSGVIPADKLIALGVEVLTAWRGEDTRTHADVYYAAERVVRSWDALPKAGEP
jgi:hypothetical protein